MSSPLDHALRVVAAATAFEGEQVGYVGRSSELHASWRVVDAEATLEQVHACLEQATPSGKAYLLKTIASRSPTALLDYAHLLADEGEVVHVSGDQVMASSLGEDYLRLLFEELATDEVARFVYGVAQDVSARRERRVAAFMALSKERPDWMAGLAKFWFESGHPRFVRAALVSGLVDLPDQRATILHADAAIATHALLAVVHLRPDDCTPLLREVLKQRREPEVRLVAVNAYANCRDADSATLAQSLTDPDPRLRHRAMYGLVRHDPATAAATLAQWVREGIDDDSLLAVFLGEPAPKHAPLPVEPRYDTADWLAGQVLADASLTKPARGPLYLSTVCDYVLERRAQRLVVLLFGLLGHADPPIRAVGLAALRRIGSSECAAALRSVLGSGEASTAAEVAQAVRTTVGLERHDIERVLGEDTVFIPALRAAGGGDRGA